MLLELLLLLMLLLLELLMLELLLHLLLLQRGVPSRRGHGWQRVRPANRHRHSSLLLLLLAELLLQQEQLLLLLRKELLLLGDLLLQLVLLLPREIACPAVRASICEERGRACGDGRGRHGTEDTPELQLLLLLLLE